jgi:DedD protein
MIDSNDIHSATEAAPTDIDRLRKQARQRFIGAGVLVFVAVIGLPFILDTKPRPVSPNIAIEIPKAVTATTSASQSAPAPAPQATPDMPSQSAASPALAGSASAVAPMTAPVPAPEPTPAIAPIPVPAPVATAASAPAPGDGYAIQAGSYTDKAKLAEAIAKLEKAGFAPYTQGAISKNGTHHTRVRLGPFATQQEANSMAVKVNKLGVKTIVIKPS